MADSRQREERQAELLDDYWAALARDADSAPPPELDPEIAELAQRLEQGLRPPEPGQAFATQVRRRLLLQAVGTASRSADEDPAATARTGGPGGVWALLRRLSPAVGAALAVVLLLTVGAVIWVAGRQPPQPGWTGPVQV